MPGGNPLDVAIAAKRYGTTPVLRDVRYNVAPGEVAALLAPSGTGKTTALRIAIGLDATFAGTVTRPPGPIACVFQEPRLLPWLDVAGNLRLVAPGLSAAEIETLLALVELPGTGPLLPRALSLGMARRVAVARALAAQPALLAMDEPFASLDAGLAGRLCRTIVARARAGRMAVLMATHDLSLALAYADRILVLGGQGAATLLADLPARSQTAEGLQARFAFLGAA